MEGKSRKQWGKQRGFEADGVCRVVLLLLPILIPLILIPCGSFGPDVCSFVIQAGIIPYMILKSRKCLVIIKLFNIAKVLFRPTEILQRNSSLAKSPLK